MNKKIIAVLGILALLVALLPTAVLAAPTQSDSIGGGPESMPKEDNRPDPFTTQQLELKQQALEAKLNGKA